MKKFVLYFCALSALCLLGAGDSKKDWENLAVNSRNRLEAATYLHCRDVITLSTTETSAGSDIISLNGVRSLNGDWKFKWVGDPARRPVDFWKKGYDDSKWGVIDVPSCVEMRGYGVPHYTNIRYPHKTRGPGFLTVRRPWRTTIRFRPTAEPSSCPRRSRIARSFCGLTVFIRRITSGSTGRWRVMPKTLIFRANSILRNS